MATVRFSRELKDKIIKNAEAVFDKQMDTARDNRPSHEWGDKIYNTLFGEHVPALNNVPAYFLRQADKIKVENVRGTSCSVENVRGTPRSLEFNLSGKRPFPIEFPDMPLAEKSGYYGENITLKDVAEWEELQADVVRWRNGIKAVEEKRNQFVEQVTKIINAHATLAPALKMWQPLWDLIPESYKEHHHKVVERKKKEMGIDVDLSAMTAVVVAHKITR